MAWGCWRRFEPMPRVAAETCMPFRLAAASPSEVSHKKLYQGRLRLPAKSGLSAELLALAHRQVDGAIARLVPGVLVDPRDISELTHNARGGVGGVHDLFGHVMQVGRQVGRADEHLGVAAS